MKNKKWVIRGENGYRDDFIFSGIIKIDSIFIDRAKNKFRVLAFSRVLRRIKVEKVIL